MKGQQGLESVFNKYGITDFRWIDPKDIVTAQWVRTKCMFGCKNYGKHACCPPNVPSVSECRQLFNEYESGVIFHFAIAVEKPEDRYFWAREMNQTLWFVEREVFLQGYQKVLLLPMSSCGLCEECTGVKEDCKNPKMARPTPEAMAIDVYSTVRRYDLPIEVLTNYKQTMNKYAFLLIE
jgi:predicted metal-binding protein